MASVTIHEVHKAYGAVHVLKGVDLAIEDGEFVVLVGPSGCGKSTLLRMIAGLEEITGGIVRIGDRVVNDVAPKDRDIAMVFQSYALYPHMSVNRNMGFSLELRKRARDFIREQVDRAAGILGLSALLERLPKELSGGQRQRVAMGRAIVRQPQVFLFDEPLSNLDAKLRVQMRTEIKSLHQELRTTSVYVTHDQVEAMTMADRIVIMHDGVIQQIGTPLDLYDRPVNRFVAGFIGSPSMNFLTGMAGEGGVGLDEGVTLPLGAAAGLKGEEIVYGIRPENIALDPSGRTGVPATVEVVEPTGLSTLVYCRVAGHQICVFAMNRPDVERGQSVGLLPDTGKLHLFDPHTGDRIET
ncbi:sn-glycerol-3-phosphate ABC transporter ATP-binding protein UgpC [Inquilinus sp. CAU 1745]|uniref:ABC transporter ATP-binding protein n=1 Tax=Inquilinus sp. CAU 1745 TaxID=3140369 RepID=UPI00325ACA6B